MANVNQNVWLISFGDLLTLVLCFFISIITLSPLNPDRNGTSKTGTELAHNQVDIQAKKAKQHLYNLNIFEEDLLVSEAKISGAGLERIKNQIASAGYETRALTVETCFSPNESDSRDGWLKRTGLLNGIRSQVFDAVPSLSTKNLLLRNSSVDCDDNAAARLILEF